jgi:quercetin dioxygenase-like cupin family protein
MNGDPSKHGEYTVRLSMPNGYTIMPHFHPTDEHITVISGTFVVGMADSVDPSHSMHMAQGDFATAGAHVHHWARAQGQTVVQVHGTGPFAITYLKPADDPRHATAAR